MKFTPVEQAERHRIYVGICNADVRWYLQHGRYGVGRIRTDRDGVQYVIGDWSWNRLYPNHLEFIDNALPSAKKE